MLATGSTDLEPGEQLPPAGRVRRSSSKPRIRSRPRSVISRADWSSTSLVYSRTPLSCLVRGRVPCSLNTVSRLKQVPARRRRHWQVATTRTPAATVRPPAALRAGPAVRRCAILDMASSAKPIPPSGDDLIAAEAASLRSHLRTEPDRLEAVRASVQEATASDTPIFRPHDLSARPPAAERAADQVRRHGDPPSTTTSRSTPRRTSSSADSIARYGQTAAAP